MAENAVRKRLNRALVELEAIADPLARLEAVRYAQQQLERLETETVVQLRKAETTWTAIGALYGLTKQGAQQRFRAARERMAGDG